MCGSHKLRRPAELGIRSGGSDLREGFARRTNAPA